MTAWEKYDEHTINAGEDQRKAYYDQLLKRYAMSLYKWDGLNTFLMERILYESGKAVVFRSKFLPDLSIGRSATNSLMRRERSKRLGLSFLLPSEPRIC